MNNEQGFFFEIPASILSKKEILSRVRSGLMGGSFFRITTVGPEFLLRAREDEKFKENLLRADLRVADGFGITLAGRLSGRYIPRFPGADLMHEILREAEKRNLSVFLAVRKGGLSSLDEIQTALLKKYPKLKIIGKEFSKPYSLFFIPYSDIVFCNFGAPDQEYFLESLRGQASGVRLAMGVGGAFDFLTGKLPRAPKLFRALGMEWLWRLFLQPSRWKRIWRAVVVFPMVITTEYFRMKTMTIYLKEATFEDIPVLIDIEKSVAGTRLYSSMENEEEWEEELQKNFVFLVKKNNEVVGNVSYERKENNSIYISGLAIKPSFQGQGLGRSVMKILLEDVLRNEKHISLVTHPDNSVALGLYQSFGFVVGERKENYFGDGEPRVELLLER